MEIRRIDLSDAEEECGDGALDRVRREYEALLPGDRLEVLTGVAEQAFGISAWSRKVGGEIVEEKREGGLTRLVVRRPTG